MRAVLTVIAIFTALPATGAQEMQSNQQTAPPPGARYEIVQATQTAKGTYRLDRFTGQVDQLTSAGNSSKWTRMPMVRSPKVDGNVPRFQILLSGISVKYQFLLDTQTGRTWEVVETSKERPNELGWVPFEE